MTLDTFLLSKMLYEPDKKFPTSQELCEAATLTLADLPDYKLDRQESDGVVIFLISRDHVELGRLIVDSDQSSSYGMHFTIPDRMNLKQGVTDNEWQLKREFEEICVKVAQRAKKLKMDRLGIAQTQTPEETKGKPTNELP